MGKSAQSEMFSIQRPNGARGSAATCLFRPRFVNWHRLAPPVSASARKKSYVFSKPHQTTECCRRPAGSSEIPNRLPKRDFRVENLLLLLGNALDWPPSSSNEDGRPTHQLNHF